MVRTLPWATTTKKRARQPTLPKEAQEADADNTSGPTEARSSSPVPNSPAIRSRARIPRSPSSSPPPPPPPAQRSMIEGYDNDDIYIMVEDEFEATAKRFSARHHHDQWKEMRRTKRRRISQSPPLRPTDRVTKQSKVAQIKKAQENLTRKQKAHLQNSKDDESNSDIDEDLIDTTLGGVLLNPPKRPSQRTLEGLGPLRSNTKASHGIQSTLTTEKKTSMLGIDSENEGATNNNRSSTGEETTDDSDDDLDAPAKENKPTTWASKSLRASPDPISPIMPVKNPTLPSNPPSKRNSTQTSLVSAGIQSQLSSIPLPPKISQSSSTFSSVPRNFSNPSVTSEATSVKRHDSKLSDSDDDDFPKPTPLPSTSFGRLKKRSESNGKEDGRSSKAA